MNSLPAGTPADDGLLQYRPPESLVSDDQKVVILEYWRSIYKRRFSIIGLILAAAILAAVVAQAITPIYRASATLLIEPGRSRIVSIDDVLGTPAGNAREAMATQIEVIRSRDVVEAAVRDERLWDHPDYDPRRAAPSLAQRMARIWGTAEVPKPWDETALVAGAVARAQLELTVEGVGTSQLVRLHYESPDAALAVRMANRMAQAYIDNQRQVRMRTAQQANAALMDTLSELKEKLTASEQALQQYREQHGLVNLAGSALTLAGQQALAVTDSLSKARAKRLELEGAYRQIRSVSHGDYASVPWVMRDPAVQDSQRQLSVAQRRVLELSQTLGPRHDRVLEAESQVAEIEQLKRRQSAAAADSLRREYEAAVATEQALAGDLAAVRSSVNAVNRNEFGLAALEREVITNRQLYDMFVTRGKETAVVGDVQALAARVVERAVDPGAPVRPVKQKIIGLAVLAAAMLGAVAALLLDALDSSLKGADDAEQRLRLPMLTTLPLLTGPQKARAAVIVLDSPQSHFAEAVRTARTGVILSNLDTPHKTLLVTSTVPGEGKTTVAINLALAHAQTQRTLLIDADMRRPQIATRLGLDLAAKGLTNLVANQGSVAECLQQALPGSNLTVLTVGDLPPNPLELLLSQRFAQLLSTLQADYDIVVIDSPPVGLVSDALVLAPLTTGTVLVARAMATPTPLVRKSIRRLQAAGANLLGLVLNAVDFTRSHQEYGGHHAGDGYGYGYGSGSGYGYGYGKDHVEACDLDTGHPGDHLAGAGKGDRDGKPALLADTRAQDTRAQNA